MCQTIVLWHSQRFKNVILIAPTDLIIDDSSDSIEFGNPIGLMFSGAQVIRNGYWKFQGTVEIDVHKDLYTFNSAGEQWIGDIKVGPELKDSPYILLACAGMAAVEEHIKKLLSGNYHSLQSTKALNLLRLHRFR